MHENCNYANTNKAQQGADTRGGEASALNSCLERIKGYKCRSVYNYFGTLHADEGNEKTDTSSNTQLQALWNAVEDCLADWCNGKQNKDNTLNKNCSQCHLPRIAHSTADSECKECIQAHARSKSKWIV